MSSLRRLSVIVVLVAAMLPIAVTIVRGRFWPARDLASGAIPWRTEWARQIRSGNLPIWNPASNHGRPLLANPNASALYPPTALFLALSPERAAAWHVALHHLVFLVGAFILARRAGAGPGAATLGMAAAAGGVALSQTLFLNSHAAFAWGPWVLATAVPAPGRRGWTRALGAGALIGLQVLAGEPVTALLAALGWTILVVAGWRGVRAGAILVAACTSAAIAAPVLLPLAAGLAGTMRGAVGFPAGLGADALGLVRWPELLAGHLLGTAVGDYSSGFWADPSFPWVRYYPLVFVGSTVLLLLPFARRRKLRPWWLVFGIGFGGAVLLSWHPITQLASQIPGLRSMRYGIKLLQLEAWVIPVLVAGAWEEFAKRSPCLRRRIAAAALAGCTALVPFALAPEGILKPVLRRLYPASRTTLDRQNAAELGRRFATDLAALAVPPLALLFAPGAVGVLAVATVAANSLAGEEVLGATAPAIAWASAPPLAQALPAGARIAIRDGRPEPGHPEANPNLARFWGARAGLYPGSGVRWGLGYVLDTGPDGLEPLAHETLAVIAGKTLPVETWARVARALGADAVAGAEPIPGWKSTRIEGVWQSIAAEPAPRVYMATVVQPVSGTYAVLAALADPHFRPGIDALVDGQGGARSLGPAVLHGCSGPPHDRRFEVEAAGPGLLVVQQSHVPGWRADIDGVDVPVVVANGCAMGVYVPSGRHRVRLRVDLRPYLLGLGGPPLVLLGFLLARRKQVRNSATSGEAPNRPPRCEEDKGDATLPTAAT